MKKPTIYSYVNIRYSDHVYTATVRRIEDIVQYLHEETRPFAIDRSFKVINAKNSSYRNRLEKALFEDNTFDNNVGLFNLAY